MKKFLCLILTILLTMAFICACNSSDDYEYESSEDDYGYNDYEEEEEEEEEILSKYEAIARAKAEYEHIILSESGFNSDASLEYGECTAEQRYNSSCWTVTLRGNIKGTVDDFHVDYEIIPFSRIVDIS